MSAATRATTTTLRTLIRRPAFLGSLALFLVVGVVWVVVAVGTSAPPSLDQRTHDVAAQIQCPVCHNGESVADSETVQAAQIRVLIRQQLAEGKSDQQVLSYFESRYGDTILESPPKRGFTTLIWLAPVLMLLAGLGVVLSVAREWRPAVVAAPPAEEEDEAVVGDLAPEEQARLRATLRRELAADEGYTMGYGTEGV